VTQDELAAEQGKRSALVRSFERKQPTRKPFSEHLPREPVDIPALRRLAVLRLCQAVEAR
jgi:hypothetical protein